MKQQQLGIPAFPRNRSSGRQQPLLKPLLKKDSITSGRRLGQGRWRNQT
jgi:hypothetical protein